MVQNDRFRALFAIFCTIALMSPCTTPTDSLRRDSEDCKPVVKDGKEAPQRTKYSVDNKRSFGPPGSPKSKPVMRKHCEIDLEALPPKLPGQPHDCADIQASGKNISGIYGIYPGGIGNPFNVYCDMKTDGGGWTVFQRRMDGSVDFARNWNDYKKGFGIVSSEHWLGNEKIHRLSTQKSYELRIHLEDIPGNTRYASYRHFHIENENEKYKLVLQGYSGNAGNSLSQHNEQNFSTPDQDNDNSGVGNCAKAFRAGWWFNKCFNSNLNGLFLNGSVSNRRYAMGVLWQGWLGTKYSLPRTEMKIRPVIGNTSTV